MQFLSCAWQNQPSYWKVQESHDENRDYLLKLMDCDGGNPMTTRSVLLAVCTQIILFVYETGEVA